MLATVGRVIVRTTGAQGAENRVACLAKQQLLINVNGTFRNDLPPLPGHQIQQLVDQKGGRQSRHAATGYRNQFAANWATERTRIPGLGGGYPGQTVQTHGVGALEQLRRVLAPIVHAWNKAETGSDINQIKGNFSG